MSFLDQVRRHIEEILRSDLRQNLLRLLELDPLGVLPRRIRGPVLGTRGEAGSSVPVGPEPPPVFGAGNFYGHPHPNSPPIEPDPGALWANESGTWVGYEYPDWQDTFRHPPGLQVGNVFWRSRVADHVISWHWYSSAGPPGNAIKYQQSVAAFTDWIADDQSLNHGGSLSRDVLHEGRRLYHLPENFSCIGACWADDWLFMVGLNPSGPGTGGGWIYSGYSVNNTVECGTSTDAVIYVLDDPSRSPDLVFTLGSQIRIEGEIGQVDSVDGPLANDCYQINLVSPLGQTPTLGAPIELVKTPVFSGHTKIFAIQTTTNLDDELEVSPGAILYEIGELNRNDFTQQFLGHPDGKNMIGLQYDDNGTTVDRDIHRLEFDTASTPPVLTPTTESRINNPDEIYILHSKTTPVDSGCTENTWNDKDVYYDEANPSACFNCEGDDLWGVTIDMYYTGSEGVSREYIQNNDRIERNIRPEDRVRTIAIDYDSDGNELEATLVVDYSSSIDTVAENKFTSYDSQDGYFYVELSCVPRPPFPSLSATCLGTLTRIAHTESSFKAQHRLLTDLSVYIAVNGDKKLELGSIQDDITVDAVDSTRTGYYTRTETYENSVNSNVGVDPQYGCPIGPTGRTDSFRPSNNPNLVNQVIDQDGTVFGFQCISPDYNYTNWPIPNLAYDMRRIATHLLYMDLRSGIYVTQGREGAVHDIYQLPQAVARNTQMYPYTVDSNDFVPPTPIPNPEDYDRHWTSWGVDFAQEAIVGSPIPTWVVMKGFRRKQQPDWNPINWKPLESFIKTNEPESFAQGSAFNDGRYLINVFVELPTPGQETLQVVQLRDPQEDPLTLVNFPQATRIRNIGAV